MYAIPKVTCSYFSRPSSTDLIEALERRSPQVVEILELQGTGILQNIPQLWRSEENCYFSRLLHTVQHTMVRGADRVFKELLEYPGYYDGGSYSNAILYDGWDAPDDETRTVLLARSIAFLLSDKANEADWEAIGDFSLNWEKIEEGSRIDAALNYAMENGLMSWAENSKIVVLERLNELRRRE